MALCITVAHVLYMLQVSSSVSDVGNVKMKMQGLSSFHTSLLSINLSELIFSVSSDVLALSKVMSNGLRETTTDH